jgi:ATP-dependent DNA helicase RecG
LIERRRAKAISFDVQPIMFASISDLSQSEFESSYLPSIIASDVLAQNHRSYQQKLASCKMIDGVDSAHPTVLGALVLGNQTRDLLPCAYLQFLRIDGTLLTDPIIDSSNIDGQLAQVLRRIDEKLSAHITISVSLQSDVEIAKASYPKVALQQLIRNAVMHRTYEATHAPIRVTWFNDRIEILSPGGPFGIVNRDNFGSPGITDYRNPALAEAMRALGFVQRFGVGIATARKELIANGNPPLEIDVQDGFVCSTLKL